MDRLHHKFHAACKYDTPAEAFKYLKKGANIDHIDPHTGNSALLDACARGRTRMIDYLLKKGADPHIRNKNGETALILTIKSRNLMALETILKHNAVYYQRKLSDNNGQNADDWAQKTISDKFFTAIINAEAEQLKQHQNHKNILQKNTSRHIQIKRRNKPNTPSKP